MGSSLKIFNMENANPSYDSLIQIADKNDFYMIEAPLPCLDYWNEYHVIHIGFFSKGLFSRVPEKDKKYTFFYREFSLCGMADIEGVIFYQHKEEKEKLVFDKTISLIPEMKGTPILLQHLAAVNIMENPDSRTYFFEIWGKVKKVLEFSTHRDDLENVRKSRILRKHLYGSEKDSATLVAQALVADFQKGISLDNPTSEDLRKSQTMQIFRVDCLEDYLKSV